MLTWSARGFGRSTGEIHLNSPDYEIRDAQRLVDWLAARADIAKVGDDPKVGVVGGSYGGALALMLAGQDSRVDAIVPMITWNDLARAFLPESTGGEPIGGVFKKQWAGLFFGSGGSLDSLIDDFTDQFGTAGGDTAGDPGNGEAPGGGIDPALLDDPDIAARLAEFMAGRGNPACGRFAPEVCAAYLDVATTGRPSQATIDLLRRSSPAPTLSRITAPTLLIQGQADSLFPLTEAEANYRGLAAAGTPVRVDWFTGGHDGGEGPQSDRDRLRFLTITWLDHYLLGIGDEPGTGFTYSRVTGFDAETRRISTSGFRVDAFPDADGARTASVALFGPPQPVANPPDGNPAAISTLPGGGGGGFSSFLTGFALEVPGQNGTFISAPLPQTLDVVGTPTVQIRAASPTGEAVLFVKLYDFDPQAGSNLPFGLVAPVRLTGLPADLDQAEPVTVTLPGIVHRFEAGHRLRLTVATSDQAFTTPVEPTVYTVGLPAGGASVTLPQLSGTPITNPEVIWRYVLAALVVLIAVGLTVLLVVARVRRRRNATTVVRRARRHAADGPGAAQGVRRRVRGRGERGLHRAPRTGGRPARPERGRQDNRAAGAARA